MTCHHTMRASKHDLICIPFASSSPWGQCSPRPAQLVTNPAVVVAQPSPGPPPNADIISTIRLPASSFQLAPPSTCNQTRKQKLTSRNPAFFSTAARAMASLTKMSIYFPTAAFASLDILVESLVKNSCSIRVSRSLGMDFSGAGASSVSPPRAARPCCRCCCCSCCSSSLSSDSKGSLCSDAEGVSVVCLFLVPGGRPRPRPDGLPAGMVKKRHASMHHVRKTHSFLGIQPRFSKRLHRLRVTELKAWCVAT